jgi:hypothetical protein
MIYFLIASKIFECHFNKHVDGRFKYKYALSFERITRRLNHKRIILTIQVIKIAPLRHIYCYVNIITLTIFTFIFMVRYFIVYSSLQTSPMQVMCCSDRVLYFANSQGTDYTGNCKSSTIPFQLSKSTTNK